MNTPKPVVPHLKFDFDKKQPERNRQLDYMKIKKDFVFKSQMRPPITSDVSPEDLIPEQMRPAKRREPVKVNHFDQHESSLTEFDTTYDNWKQNQKEFLARNNKVPNKDEDRKKTLLVTKSGKKYY